MGDVTTHILSPMFALYGPLETDDADMVMDLYERALAGYANATLQRAFLDVSRSYFPSKRNPHPAPAMFVRACEKIVEEVSDGRPDEDARTKAAAVSAEDRAAAKLYLHTNPSSLIDMAINNGWSRSLEDLARSVIRKFRLANGRRPSSAEMHAFRISKEDVKYYDRYGLPHLPSVKAEIVEARKSIVVHREDITSRSRAMSGDRG